MAPWRVVITDFTESGHEIESAVFAASGLDIDLVRAAETPGRSLASDVTDADALLVQFAPISSEVIESLTRCRVISRYGIGVDMIDLEAAAKAGIPVANVPDFCIDEVSTQTIGFLIDLNRATIPLNAHVHDGRWGSPPPVTPPRRLAGQVLGIVGMGAIGRAVAAKAAALGLRVMACDPYASDAAGAELVGLDELLVTADYVTLHCPLTEETRALIGAAQLAMMKPAAYLLNLSRGPVVDQGALLAALEAGQIAGAALDVMTTEPPAADDPLLGRPDVVLTPHSASWSAESAVQLRRDAAQNIVDVLSGRLPRSVVNAVSFPEPPRTSDDLETS